MRLVLALVLCVTLSVSGSAASSPDTIEVPFTLQKGAIIIAVTLKGKGPFNMAIATGSPRSSIAWEAREVPGYQLLWTIEPLTGKQITYVQAAEMMVGRMKIDTLPMRLAELDAYSREMGLQLHGILGYDFLRGRVIRIDYHKKILTFLPKDSLPKQPSAAANPPLVSTSIEVNADDPRPVIDDVSINGVKMKMMLDTWQNLPLALTPQAVKQIGLPVGGEKTPPRLGTVDTLEIGRIKINAIETAFYAKGTGLDHGLKKYGGILGTAFFQNYVVTVDFARKVLIIE